MGPKLIQHPSICILIESLVQDKSNGTSFSQIGPFFATLSLPEGQILAKAAFHPFGTQELVQTPTICIPMESLGQDKCNGTSFSLIGHYFEIFQPANPL